MYNIASDRRFNKPAPQSVIDLINGTYSTQFGYTDLDVNNPTAYPAERVTDTSLNTVIQARWRRGEDNFSEASELHYRRLHIGRYLDHLPRFYGQGQTQNDPARLLEHLREEFLIEIAAEECEISFADTLNEDGSLSVILTPVVAHLVWIGEVEFFAVPDDHIGLDVQLRILRGLRLADLKVQ